MSEHFDRPTADWDITRKPVHPGEILREDLLFLDRTADTLALELQVPVGEIIEILQERRGISADMASRLACYFGISAEFWLNLQHDYERVLARQTAG